MSVGVTVTMSPVTGGMLSVWPLWRAVLDLRSLAHATLIVETWNFAAIAARVSPALTL